MSVDFEGERLLLRPRNLDDLDDCLDMDADPDVVRYVGGTPVSRTENRVYLTGRITLDYPAGFGYWTISPKEDPAQFLGWVCLLPCTVLPGVEIGWRVVRTGWGRGIATEASRIVLSHALESLGLERVIATIHPENVRSHRVAEKLGMSYVGGGLYLGEPCVVYERRRSNSA
jgi:RimJ/RimL family protein N-acetyltransferase